MKYPVRVVATGAFSEEDIEICQRDFPALPPRLQELVEARWTAEFARNPNLANRPLLAAHSVELIDNGKRLRLNCGLSTYKNFMGTTTEAAVTEFEGMCHRAIGVLAVTHTADGYFLVGVRSPKIDWGTLRHTVAAGRLQPDEGHPFSGIYEESQSELGLKRKEITLVECIGVVADQTWGRLNYEFVFRVHTSLTAQQVMKRAKNAASAAEHCHIEFFPWDPPFVRELLWADPDGFVPTGWAGIALCLKKFTQGKYSLQWDPVSRTYEEHMGRRLKMLVK